MTRIFTVLASIAMILLATNFYLGMTGGDYNAVSNQLRVQQAAIRKAESQTVSPSLEPLEEERTATFNQLQGLQQKSRRHVLMGLFATLMAVMVNSISVTYFIGTSRWCQEVSDTYALDKRFVEQSSRIKRRAFPWSLLGICSALAIAAFGAAADPGTLRAETAKWVAPHFLMAIGGLFIIGWSLWAQVGWMRKNQANINDILRDVHRIRESKGLEVESPPPSDVASSA